MKKLNLKELQKRELQMIKGGVQSADDSSSTSRCGWCWCSFMSGTHATKKQTTTCRSASF